METITVSISIPKAVWEGAKEKAKFTYKTNSEYVKDLIISDTAQKALPL